MPFGLRNAQARFQRLMDRVLEDAKWQFVMAFLDNLVIYSDTFEEHVRHVQEILRRLQAAGFTVNPSKIQLCTQELSLLGFRLAPGIRMPDPDKLVAIREFPEPQNVKELQRFLGLLGYYRAFVADFAGLARPLHALLKKDARWEWTEVQHSAMQALIQRLCATTALALPDLNRTFVIQADACGTGVGAVLLQEYGSELRPVAFASRTLTPAERNYSITELECLAVIFALQKFRMYVEYSPFVIETDHQALAWLKRLKEPVGRLARWSLQLQGFDYTIRYRAGRNNAAADALSRAAVGKPTDSAEASVCVVSEKENLTPWGLPIERQALVVAQNTDPGLAKIVAGLAKGGHPSDGSADAERLGTMLDQYMCDRDGLLLRYFAPWDEDDEEAQSRAWKVVVPRKLRRVLLEYFHDEALAGHLGAAKTYKRLQTRVTWRGMKQDALRYVRGCAVC